MITVSHYICSQFERPRGIIGKISGGIMAKMPSNRKRNRWAISLLNLDRQDHLLEIGHGPGVALQYAITDVCSELRATGIDHSPAMTREAKRRVGHQGRVDLITGDIERDEIQDQLRKRSPFSAVLSVNVCQFWRSPRNMAKFIGEIAGVKTRIAMVYQPRGPKASPEDARGMQEKLLEAFWDAGFHNIQDHWLLDSDMPAVAVTGEIIGVFK